MKYLFLSITLVISLISTFSLNSCSGKKEKKENTESTDVKTDAENQSSNSSTDVSGGEVYLITTAEFKQKIYNFDESSEWKFKGTTPCIVDFYADWCKPCKMVAPIMDELAKQYGDKVIFYKVNVDNEPDLANAFGVQSIPSMLFCPGDGSKPQMSTGALGKEDYKKIITDVLKVSL